MAYRSNIFKVKKMRNSEVMYMVNKQDNQEFYQVDPIFSQSEVDDRDYHRDELNFIGSRVSVRNPVIKQRALLQMAGLGF